MHLIIHKSTRDFHGKYRALCRNQNPALAHSWRRVNCKHCLAMKAAKEKEKSK